MDDNMHPTISHTSNAHTSQIIGPEFLTRNITKPIVKPSLTKNAVINAFTGLYFNREQWNKYLTDAPAWLRVCSVEKKSDGTSATWNPVLIALALLTKGVSIHKLDAIFFEMKEWAKAWKKKSALYRY